MKKSFAKLWPKLSLKTWGMISLFTFLFVMSVIITINFERSLSRLPIELAKKASQQLGYEVQIEGMSFSGLSSHIKSVRIATDPKMTIEDIQLRFSFDPLNLKVLIKRASGTIRGQTIDLINLQNIFRRLRKNIGATSQNPSQALITSQRIPDLIVLKLEHIHFANLLPHSILTANNSQPMIDLGNITLQMKEKSLSYQMKLDSQYSHRNLKGIKGKILYRATDGHFHFKNIFVLGKTDDHPQISGTFSFEDEHSTINTSLNSQSLEFVKFYIPTLKDSKVDSIDITLKLKRDDSISHFKGSLKLNHLALAHKILAKRSLDPISPTFRLHGSWDHMDKKLDLFDGHVLLQSIQEPSKQIQFKFEAAADFTNSRYGKWKGTISLPKTSCQDFFNQIPPNFIPNIKAFSWRGHLSFVLPLNLNISDAEAFSVDFSNFDFSCDTQNTPTEYTVDHLRSPFIIERKQIHSDEYVKIPLNLPPLHLPFEAVHPYFRRALIAFEDIKFWSHPGIDVEALKNATDLNLQEKRVVLGGSTITMQTAKNLYLNFDRNLSRKFEELLIAWHLEKILTKKQIFETYINIVEFGPNIFGLKNAAKHFFDKTPEDLSLLEAVYLGAMLPSPIKRYRFFCEGRISQGFQEDLNQKIQNLVNLNFVENWEGQKATKTSLTFHRPEGIENSTLCQRSLALNTSQ